MLKILYLFTKQLIFKADFYLVFFNFPHLVKGSSKKRDNEIQNIFSVQAFVFRVYRISPQSPEKSMFIKCCCISFSNFFLLEIHLHIKNSNYFISEKKFGFSQTTFFERFEATIQRAGARLGHGRSEWLKLSRYKNCLLSVTVHLFATNARKGRNAQESCTSDTFYLELRKYQQSGRCMLLYC